MGIPSQMKTFTILKLILVSSSSFTYKKLEIQLHTELNCSYQ